MLPFFRKIRWRLAQDNQFLKYSRYAIGEIVLVVIGILIALQINNWNEEQKEKARINTHLESMKVCLEEDKDWLTRILDVETFRHYSMYKLIELAEDSVIPMDITTQYDRISYKPTFIWNENLPDEPNTEFILQAFAWSGRHLPMIPNMHCIEELKNSGLYSKFENENIKKSINSYYSNLDFRALAFEDRLLKTEEQWIDSLRKNGVRYIDVSNIDDPLLLIQNNSGRITLLQDLAGIAIWRANGASILIELIDDTISLIDEHLKTQ